MTPEEYRQLSPQQFCERAGGARHEGADWFCFCPVHGDENTPKGNLHVSAGTKAHLIFHCVTRKCDQKEIIEAFQKRGLYPEKKKPKRMSTEEKDLWSPILPVPDDAPSCPQDMFKGGTIYKYRNAEGRLLLYIKRVQRGNEKVIFPITFCRKRESDERAWQFIGIKNGGLGTPLYGLDRLAQNADLPVLIVEGEKCADVVVGGYVLISWMGGAGRVLDADWAPVHGRDLTIWRDADEDGFKAQASLIKKFPDAKVVNVSDLPNKADIADMATLGQTPAQILERIQSATVPVDPLRPSAPLKEGEEPDWHPTSVDQAFRQIGAFIEYRALSEAGNRLPYTDTIHYDKSAKITIEIANFRARIATEFILDDGNERQDGNLPRRYEIVVFQRGRVYRGIVAAEKFRDQAWVERIIGASGIVPNQEFPNVCEAIKRYSIGLTKAVRIYKHVGWRKFGNEWLYLHGGGALGATMRTDIRVELPGKLSSLILLEPFKEAPDIKQAIEESMAFARFYPKATIPAWCAIWRSIVERMPHATTITGDSGAFKTEVAILVMQHFGVGFDHQNKMPLKFDDTPAGMETTLNACMNAICVVDNYRPGDNEGSVAQAKYAKDADRLVAAVADGTSIRERGAWAGQEGVVDAPSKPSRATGLLTGEEAPGQGSTHERALETRIDKPEIRKREAELSRLQGISRAGRFNRLTSRFIQCLAQTLEETRAGLPALREKIAHQISTKSTFTHPRARYIVADTYTGFVYFKAFAEAHGVEIPADFEQLVKNTLLELVQARQTDQSVERYHLKFLIHLQNALASGLIYATTMEGGQPSDPVKWGWRERPQKARISKDGETEEPPTQYEPRPGAAHVCYIDEETGITYWLPDITFKTIQKTVGDIGIKNPSELWNRLKDDHLLAFITHEKRNGKKYENALYAQKGLAILGRPRLLCLKREAFVAYEDLPFRDRVIAQLQLHIDVLKREVDPFTGEKIQPDEIQKQEIAALRETLNSIRIGDDQSERLLSKLEKLVCP